MTELVFAVTQDADGYVAESMGEGESRFERYPNRMKRFWYAISSILVIIGLSVGIGAYRKHRLMQTTVSVDEWWNFDFAANACEFSENTHKDDETLPTCWHDSAEDVAAFEGSIKTAFAIDTACQGLTLQGGGVGKHQVFPHHSSVNGWSLMLDMFPAQSADKARWTVMSPTFQVFNGEDKASAAQVVHSVCTIMRHKGGTPAQ